MSVTLDQQIEWLNSQLAWMKRSLPEAVERGSISEETAAFRIMCAHCSLCTLTQLRGIAIKGAM